MRSYKKGLAVLLLVLFAFMGFVYFAEERGHHYMLGSGTELDPYQVATEADLYAVRNDLTAFYLQMADIDLSGYSNWVPIGNYSTPFIGTYNGNNFNINNLTISDVINENLGLFGYTATGKLSNINLIDANIIGYYYTGALVGYSESIISNCSSSGNVSGYAIVGGLVGYQDISNIIESSSSCIVNGTNDNNGGSFGGLIGVLCSTSEKCFATGDVSGCNNIGGLIGASTYGVAVNCFSTGVVTSTKITNDFSYVGGFCGAINSGELENCYSTGFINIGISNYAGGLVGKNTSATITSCYYDLETSGQSDTDKGTPKTTAEMKTRSTFIDWDFTDTWRINTGEYPTLGETWNCEAPSIIGPTEINCSKPLVVLQTAKPSYESGLYHLLHFRIQAYADEAGETLISTTDSSINPELFECSLDNSLSWTAFPTGGLASAQYGARVRARVDCGPRLQVWMRASVGSD